MKLTVVVCTHNRKRLLARTLGSLNEATRPHDCTVEILVVANACTDGTVDLLSSYGNEPGPTRKLPLRWVSEPIPGKSRALNRAIELVASGILAFVDDDHRVHSGYLASIVETAAEYAEASLFCGRILPDWDGREPKWVHDTGPYRIYPLPVPRYDEGDEPRQITRAGPVPGGGNLCVRREVFDRVGGFSTTLGPRGHDLGGGEDAEFVYRCLSAGERIQYVPTIRQYHYVDPERLRLGYLIRKSYQRSRSVIRSQVPQGTSIPRFVWRKLATYLGHAVFSLYWPRTRFYLVRVAAALGELRGFLDRGGTSGIGGALPLRADAGQIARWSAVITALGGLGAIISSERIVLSLTAVFWVALSCTALLLLKSFYDFSQTGPPLQREILRSYRSYSLFALARLGFWVFVLCAAMAACGVVLYAAATLMADAAPRFWPAAAAGTAGVFILTLLQFCRHLLYVPGSVAASYHYRSSRLYPLWRLLTRRRLLSAQWALGCAVLALLAASAWHLTLREQTIPGAGFFLLAAATALGVSGFTSVPSTTHRAVKTAAKRPNILMIGSDTLRADRLVANQYPRDVAPYIDSLAKRGTHFTACYVPCARTAPSLLSLFTGTWPHRHGIRDNFVGDPETRLAVPAMATILARHGYRTAAVSDWCGGDLGKFPLGFEILDLPDDQWNIKYLIRQGPKDLRLLLSLFTHNAFGKRFLPELYYLAGVPLTSLVGRDARALISRFATEEAPFFLNVFMSTTHPPFGSEYPFYSLWADKHYAGESKFVMARLTDPWDIIRRQGDSKKEFDLDQIIDLYDGCVRNFDDEVKKILEHLAACGLADNTIVVIYSDHGMEFFEHDTWGQGNSVRGDASARVPLIIADPRRGGTAPCPHVVRSIDVAPTLLELAGIAPPPYMDGVSLSTYLRDERVDLDLVAFNETGMWLTELPGMPADHLRYPDLFELLEVPDRLTGTLAIKQEYRKAVIEAKDRMVRRGTWKLTYRPTIHGALYALFDLAEDPECRYDVSGMHPKIVAELKQKLTEWMQDRETGASTGGRVTADESGRP